MYKTFIINDKFLIYDLLIHKSKLHNSRWITIELILYIGHTRTRCDSAYILFKVCLSYINSIKIYKNISILSRTLPFRTSSKWF